MTVVIILLGVGLAVSLAFNLGLFGNNQPAKSAQAASNTLSAPAKPQSDDERARKLETDLDKKKKEFEELKKTQAELKDELKAAKKKLFDQNQSEKAGDDLAKARAEVERHASIQLESTRAELATALADVQRLKSAEENRGKKRPERTEERAPAAAAEPKPAVERPVEVVQRVIRELSDVEKERIARLEQQSSNDRKKANELERETRSLKAKVDRIQRESKRVYSESNLARDKFRAVETRLNRTLLENDLLKRAIVDIEKKTGQHAEHVVPTAEEFAAADRSMKERHQAEDKLEAEARARLEAAPVASEEETPAPPAAAELAAAPAAEPTTPPASA